MNPEEHALSPWLDDADDFVLSRTPDGGVETLPVKTVSQEIYEICCVPFHVYDLDRGDHVRRDGSDVVSSIVP